MGSQAEFTRLSNTKPFSVDQVNMLSEHISSYNNNNNTPAVCVNVGPCLLRWSTRCCWRWRRKRRSLRKRSRRWAFPSSCPSTGRSSSRSWRETPTPSWCWAKSPTLLCERGPMGKTIHTKWNNEHSQRPQTVLGILVKPKGGRKSRKDRWDSSRIPHQLLLHADVLFCADLTAAFCKVFLSRVGTVTSVLCHEDVVYCN